MEKEIWIWERRTIAENANELAEAENGDDFNSSSLRHKTDTGCTRPPLNYHFPQIFKTLTDIMKKNWDTRHNRQVLNTLT